MERGKTLGVRRKTLETKKQITALISRFPSTVSPFRTDRTVHFQIFTSNVPVDVATPLNIPEELNGIA